MMDRDNNEQIQAKGIAESDWSEEAHTRNFASDHAVNEHHQYPREGESNGESSIAPLSQVNVRRQSVSRSSLRWPDLAALRRRSSALSSLLSSLTLTDFGDSFYNDYSSQANLCRWDEDDVESSTEFDKEEPTCSCTSPCDHKPICPDRRDSMSTGKITLVPLVLDFPCCGNHEHHQHTKDHSQHTKNHSDKEDPAKNESRSSFQDHHPIKPGRRASVAMVDQSRDKSLTPPPAHSK